MNIRKLKRDDFIETTCSDFVAEGLGLAHIPAEWERKPLTGFVWGVLPGERFVARVSKVHSGVFHAVLATQQELPEDWLGKTDTPFIDDDFALMSRSPERVESDCENFVRCGGCKMRHLSYEDTLDWKRKWMHNHLRRNQLTFEDIVVHGSPKTSGYRNHVQIHINKYKDRGFYAPYSYTTVKFPEHGCRLFEQKESDEHFPEELELERVVRIRLDEDSPAKFTSLHTKEDKEEKYTYTVNYPENTKTRVTITNTAFFQVNSTILPLWLSRIEELVKASTGNGEKVKVLELFSGAGFITRLLSYKLPLEVMGIDSLKRKVVAETTWTNDSLGDAPLSPQFNERYLQADLTDLSRVKEPDVELLRSFLPDLLLLNPPRSGFLPDQISWLWNNVLTEFSGDIVYSSCNGATLARDLKKFSELGWQIQSMEIMDFFPYTSHFEILTRLSHS